jgi:FKBP-type peptidyl-prolyl cis-trans isomerase
MKRATKGDSDLKGEVDLTGDGGVVKTILRAGSGEPLPRNAYVGVHYTLRLSNGEEIDSSVRRGQVFKFQIFSGQVIQGWDVAVGSMLIGERALVKIQPQYGYGNRDLGRIPPNSVLYFEIELISSTLKENTGSTLLSVGILVVVVVVLYFTFNTLYPKATL